MALRQVLSGGTSLPHRELPPSLRNSSQRSPQALLLSVSFFCLIITGARWFVLAPRLLHINTFISYCLILNCLSLVCLQVKIEPLQESFCAFHLAPGKLSCLQTTHWSVRQESQGQGNIP